MSKSVGQIKAAFEKVCGHVKADVALAKRISDFQIEFINKNEDHMSFFGGNLTGVHVVRFTPQDKDKFFIDVLKIDELELEDEIANVKAIRPEWHVSRDSFNQTCMWLIHKFAVSSLPDKVKHDAMLNCALILYYRFITSVLYNSFRYPADPNLAKATYAQLNNKFSIKQYGSWQATLEARSEKLIGEDSIHYKTFLSYDDDDQIVYLINDSQGRIRDMIKNIYGMMLKVKAQGDRIKTTSMLFEHDGEQILKDKTKSLTVYTRYMHSIIGDEHTFIKQEILDVIEKIVHTASPKLVHQTLKWCSVNYKFAGIKDVEDLVEKTLLHSFTYLSENRTVFRETNDLSVLLSRLKGIYTSSKSNDKDLLEIRTLAESIIRKATSTKNASAIASVRTAVLLYIVIRAFTMSHYSGVQ